MEDGMNAFTMFARGLTVNIEPQLQKHLKCVYGTLTMSVVAAAAGGYVHLFSSMIGAGLLTGLGALASLIYLMATPYDGKNQVQRMSVLISFAFLSGCNLGPLLDLAVHINPTIVLHALVLTSTVFACFTLASLFAPRGYYLFLGGTLMSFLSTLTLLSLMNLFFGSRLLFQVNIYFGLLVMCGFVVYDTQLIMEKARNNDKDFVMHSIMLFIDFIAIFKRILIILSNKEVESKKKRRN